MKQFTHVAPRDTMGINSYHNDGRNIVAYKTGGPTGAAILVPATIPHYGYGFVYFRDLLQGDRYPALHYQDKDDPKQCIKNVIDDDKNVYYFDDYYDFIRWAADPHS